MSMFVFMPWCPIDKQYEIGQITVLPFEINKPIEDCDAQTQSRINAIMAMYKDIEGKPVQKAALIRYGNKKPIDNLSDDEIALTYDLITIACFSGIANREYLNPIGPYCNSDCFSLYVPKFSSPDFTALTTRRRDGQTLSGWSIEDISITIPVHCHAIREVSLNTDLLLALVDSRTQMKHGSWGRWQNAISCFNQANSDSENIRYQVEWVSLCSAFEHLLSAKPNAKDVARKFSQALVPSRELQSKDSYRLSKQKLSDGMTVRYEWMKEFYRIRGDFAHGQLTTTQSTAWEPLEHLVLAAIAFPLLVKGLLSRDDMYKLTDRDHAQIDCLDQFADTKDFLKPPPKQRGSLDSHWSRLVRKRCYKICVEHALANLRNLRESKKLK